MFMLEETERSLYTKDQTIRNNVGIYFIHPDVAKVDNFRTQRYGTVNQMPNQKRKFIDLFQYSVQCSSSWEERRKTCERNGRKKNVSITSGKWLRREELQLRCACAVCDSWKKKMSLDLINLLVSSNLNTAIMLWEKATVDVFGTFLCTV